MTKDVNTFTATIKTDVPSPDAYSPKRKDCYSPQFTFKGRLNPIQSDQIKCELSPAHYDRPSTMGGEVFSLKSRTKVEFPDNNPPPNQYNPDFKTGKAESRKSALAGRTNNTDLFFLEKRSKNLPSPNTYVPITPKNKIGYRFSQNQNGVEEKSRSPGPAQSINAQESFKSTKFIRNVTMKGRIPELWLEKKKKEGAIGPGSYNIPSSMNFKGGITMSSRSKSKHSGFGSGL
eukprot:EST41685.1 Hypothetical protein SS50377_18772 [Spironucleus salmonicida]